VEQQDEEWGELCMKIPLKIPEWKGESGIKYEPMGHMGAGQRTQHRTDMTTPLYWFLRIFDGDVIHRILEQTNAYVASLKARERPPELRAKLKWPPKWVMEWEELTESALWQWFACLLFVSQHKTAGEEELWSKHWFWECPGMSRFMPYKDFQRMKSALHFQADDESRERGQGERPFICKIGIMMEMIAANCQKAYSMGQNIAIDEVTLGMSSASEYRRITKHKKKHESIQLMAIGESTEGLQYCWLFHLDENDGEVGKIHKHVMRLVEQLEPNAGHHVYMDNLFISSKTLNAVRELGHGAAGTCRAKRGMPARIEAIKSGSPMTLLLKLG